MGIVTVLRKLILVLSALTCLGTFCAEKPIVVLLSIDGYRHDYTETLNPPNLQAFLKSGASRAKSLIPIYPSLTFPNHYTMVTGLYADQHGIVGNEFADVQLKRRFSIYNEEKFSGDWYRGLPIWLAVKNKGMLSASVFWPGSDSTIHGDHPSYYLPYNQGLSDRARLNQVMEWLHLPEETRPRFIAAYFSGVDHAGHHYGPNSGELRKAVLDLDAELGLFFSFVATSALPINVFVVSDHGMVEFGEQGRYFLEDYDSLQGVEVSQEGPFLSLNFSQAGALERVLGALQGKTGMRAYRREDIPAEWHFSGDHRVGEVLVDLDGLGWIAPRRGRVPALGGMHGYNPFHVGAMKGIFYAKGPNVTVGNVVEEGSTRDVFGVLMEVLGFDGVESPLRGVLTISHAQAEGRRASH